MNFFIDTGGTTNNESNIVSLPTTKIIDSDVNDNEEFSEVEPPTFVHKIFELIKDSNDVELQEKPKTKNKIIEKDDVDLTDVYKNMGWTKKTKKNKGIHGIPKLLESDVNRTKKIDEILEKSALTSDFERQHSITPSDQTTKSLKKEKKREREKTKGVKWYGLPATEITDEIKNDLEILQMRSVLNPKHFYKKNDMKVLPKYFQIGKVLDSHIDFYNNRCTKKERKRTLVDELMADAEFSRYNKKKYKEVLAERQTTDYIAFKKAKKNNKIIKRKTKGKSEIDN